MTPELEDLDQQMATGHYASVSEIIREALRGHIHAAPNMMDMRIVESRRQTASQDMVKADSAYFDKTRAYIKAKA